MTFFIENNMAFQIGQSTDHAILELADQIYDSFDKNLFTLGVFTDL